MCATRQSILLKAFKNWIATADKKRRPRDDDGGAWIATQSKKRSAHDDEVVDPAMTKEVSHV